MKQKAEVEKVLAAGPVEREYTDVELDDMDRRWMERQKKKETKDAS
jgi:hypothetical protein